MGEGGLSRTFNCPENWSEHSLCGWKETLRDLRSPPRSTSKPMGKGEPGALGRGDLWSGLTVMVPGRFWASAIYMQLPREWLGAPNPENLG